jgi:hypothetical protein
MIVFQPTAKKIEPLIKYSEVIPPNMTGDIFFGTPCIMKVMGLDKNQGGLKRA